MKAQGIKKVALSLLTLSLGLSACEFNTSSDKNETRIKVQSNQDAETIALAGEQLVTPTEFPLADRVLSLALEKDPRNQRALLYKNLLKQFMTLKGLHARVKPYVAKNGDIIKWNKWLNDSPDSAIKDFLAKGSEDISTSEQVQDLLVQYRNGIIEFYKFLKANPDMELTLNLNPYLWQKEIEKAKDQACRVEGGAWNSDANAMVDYEVVCNFRDLLQKRFNVADNIAVRGVLAGQILYFTFLTSYSIDGIDELLRKSIEFSRQENRRFEKERANYQEKLAQIEEEYRQCWEEESKKPTNRDCNEIWNNLPAYPDSPNTYQMTDKEWSAYLTKYPKMAVLRKDHSMGILNLIGGDIVSAYTWVRRYQRELCPQVAYGAPKRPGYVAEDGLCISNQSEADDNIQRLSLLLKGPAWLQRPEDSNSERVYMDPLIISRKPIKDLRQLMGSNFDSCGRRTQLVDKTFGGIFPNGDAEKYLIKEPQKGCE